MRARQLWPGLWVVILSLGPWCSWGQAQVPPLSPPAVPLATQPPAGDAAINLEERLRATEAINLQLTSQIEQMNREYREQTDKLSKRLEELSQRLDNQSNAANQQSRNGESTTSTANASSSYSATGASTLYGSVPDYFDLDTSSPYSIPERAVFGPGFQIQSEDEQYRLQIHYESQIEGRLWSQDRQIPANSGFFLPRQRFFFNGNVTKFLEYELAINRGLNNINLLNAFINLHFDDRFQLRLGRFFTPLPYDQYAISNYWLPTPERSLFTTNLSLNRQIGAMGWGYLFDKRLDYAAGVFNGSRNSFESLHNGVDFVGYVNARPFQESEAFSFAKNLNIGTSVAFGLQGQNPVPVSFRIGGGSPDANIPGIATVPFLILNPNVMEQGNRLLGSVHAAYYYKGLSLIGEWQYGFGNYTSTTHPSAVQVPFLGFYVTAGYFLTGEEIERRTRVKPLRPFVPLSKEDTWGPGAWEAVARVSQLQIGEEIFTSGFADRSIWSNSAVTTELGLNWYWNDYTKLYMFWLHGDFGDPVQYRPGNLQKSADMLWLRCQLYF